MPASDKLRVGIVGASASRGFASIAHIPALEALPQFEIVAVCTSRQETAKATAQRYGAKLAFDDPAQMAAHPDVDLVTVSVKVPDHYAPVMAAIDAGKHVYCEWPLGRNTDEAVRMLDAGERRGVRHAVGRVPEGSAGDSRYNVAQLYARLAESIRDGRPASPSFAAAVTRHRLLDGSRSPRKPVRSRCRDELEQPDALLGRRPC
jgi:Oxidoreductase family, NAD-binding Rossmann fold